MPLTARRWPDGGPLSFSQQRLWFFDRFDPGNPVYNISRAFRFRGALDVARLEDAIATIVARHDALRTIILDGEDEPIQRVHSHITTPFELVDLSHVAPPSAREEAVKATLVAGARTRIRLDVGPLIRCTLVRVAPGDHVLLVVIHHIVADGASLDVFFTELSTLYAGGGPLDPLPVQMLDFAAWQRDRMATGELASHESYWLERLAGHPPLLPLPTDRPRPEVQSFEGARLHTTIAPALRAQVVSLARRLQVTPFMVLLTAYAVLLARWTGQDDLVIGIPFVGRNRVEVERLIGFFVDTLAIRLRPKAEQRFSDFLGEVRLAVIEAVSHHEVPFDRVVEQLHPERSAGFTPVFQTMFGHQASMSQPLTLPGIEVCDAPVDPGVSRTDLTLSLHDVGGELKVAIEYTTALFDSATAADLAAQYGRILTAITTDPELALARIPLLDAAGREHIVADLNRTARDYPRGLSIPALFAEIARRRPEANAVEHGSRTLSYGALAMLAAEVASHLRSACGITRGDVVAVCLDRSPELVAAMLGVLEAGAAYLPCDPDDPSERIQVMCADGNARVAVTSRARRDVLTGQFDHVVYVDDIKAHGAPPSSEVEITGDDRAYVMFTSGSTGRPKGIAIPHRGVVRLVRGTDYLQLGDHDRVAQAANGSFDAATFEIWGPLLNGGTVVILDREDVLSPPRLATVIRDRRLTAMFVTTALFNQVVRRDATTFAPLRALLFGGEAVDPRWVRAVLASAPPARLLHVYGPTESTTFATWFEVAEVAENAVTVPIGHPLANTTAYVLDRHLEPVPTGLVGELYIGGDGLADGYVNRPELTAEAFVANPFDPTGAGRLYRTGDLVRRRRCDAAIEFVGRCDQQLKIRGFRIEPGEVEAALRRDPAVADAVVVPWDEPEGGRRLVAYVAPTPGALIDERALRAAVATALPSYMTPSEIVVLAALPMTATGKVDRSSLPPPTRRRGPATTVQEAPRDRLEAALVSIWERLLGVAPVGIHDSFFDLGGHSILAVRLLTEVATWTDDDLPLASLFRAPTIAAMAELIRSRGWRDDWGLVVRMKSGDTRPPLIWIHSAGGNLLSYSDVTFRLAADQPVLGIQAVGLEDGVRPLESVEEMAAHYISQLHDFGLAGPFHLAGLSFGGLVAYEMACRLAAAGEAVGVVALIDSSPRLDDDRPFVARWRARLRLHRHRARFHLVNLLRLPPREKLAFLAARLKTLRRRSSFYFGNLLAGWHDQLGAPLSPALYNVTRANFTAAKRYRPGAYPGEVTLFRARDRNIEDDRDLVAAWGRLALGGVTVYDVSGQHHTMVDEPHAKELASHLQACLDRSAADRREPPTPDRAAKTR